MTATPPLAGGSEAWVTQGAAELKPKCPHILTARPAPHFTQVVLQHYSSRDFTPCASALWMCHYVAFLVSQMLINFLHKLHLRKSSYRAGETSTWATSSFTQPAKAPKLATCHLQTRISNKANCTCTLCYPTNQSASATTQISLIITTWERTSVNCKPEKIKQLVVPWSITVAEKDKQCKFIQSSISSEQEFVQCWAETWAIRHPERTGEQSGLAVTSRGHLSQLPYLTRAT